jgi:hypothetical protein
MAIDKFNLMIKADNWQLNEKKFVDLLKIFLFLKGILTFFRNIRSFYEKKRKFSKI